MIDGPMVPSPVNQQRAADELFTRIQLSHAEARSVLVTSARSQPAVETVTANLCNSIRASRHEARSLSVQARPSREAAALGQEENADLTSARAAIRGAQGYTVVSADALLDRPRRLIVAAACDVVVLVVAKGRTSRLDLEETRRDIQAAGGLLVAAILLG